MDLLTFTRDPRDTYPKLADTPESGNMDLVPRLNPGVTLDVLRAKNPRLFSIFSQKQYVNNFFQLNMR
jgi:hypothetical protein